MIFKVTILWFSTVLPFIKLYRYKYSIINLKVSETICINIKSRLNQDFESVEHSKWISYRI